MEVSCFLAASKKSVNKALLFYTPTEAPTAAHAILSGLRSISATKKKQINTHAVCVCHAGSVGPFIADALYALTTRNDF